MALDDGALIGRPMDVAEASMHARSILKAVVSAAVWLLVLATAAPVAANTWRSPDAWGTVSDDGSQPPSNYDVASTQWDASSERYEIEFWAGPYGSDDVTVVTTTTTCPPGATPRVGHVGGKLLVYILDPSGDRIQCRFRFITYFGERANVGTPPLDNQWSNAAPIAVGSVHIDADIGSGTWGVDAVEWNDALERFEIDITGYGFTYYDVAIVTPTDAGCPAGITPRRGSVSGKLLVQMIAADGGRVRCGFKFVAYAARLSYLLQDDGFEGDSLQSSRGIDAYGYVSQFNLEGMDHAHGVQSVSWNAAQGRYELTMARYFNSSDQAIATVVGDAGSCPAGATARTLVSGGLLYVYILAANGSEIECSFNFIAKGR